MFNVAYINEARVAYEVVATTIGILRTGDLVGLPRSERRVRVIVVGDAEPTFIGTVDVGDVRGGGLGVHRGLRCGRCDEHKYKLKLHDGELSCFACARNRTRHQREHKSSAWRTHGGALEDFVLRSIGRGACSSSIPDRVLQAARMLLDGDEERVGVLVRNATEAMKFAMSPTIDISDLNEEEEP